MSEGSVKPYVYSLLAASLVVVADQLIKASVRSTVTLGEQIYLAPGLELVYTRNSGIAFGILAGSGTVIIFIGLVALVGLAIYLVSAQQFQTCMDLIWTAAWRCHKQSCGSGCTWSGNRLHRPGALAGIQSSRCGDRHRRIRCSDRGDAVQRCGGGRCR